MDADSGQTAIPVDAVLDQVLGNAADPAAPNPNPESQNPALVQPPPQAAPQEPPKEQQHMVPLAVMLEERREKKAQERAMIETQRQLAEALQRLAPRPEQPPPPPPIDPNLDPAGALNQMRREFVETLQARDQYHQRESLNTRLNFSERLATEKHGSDVVQAAFEAAKEAGFAPSFVNRQDPYGEMVDWFQGRQIKQEIGDPNAYKAKLEAEIRQKVIAELKGGAQPPPRNLPPSLATATSAGTATEVAVDSRDFFKSMMNSKRT